MNELDYVNTSINAISTNTNKNKTDNLNNNININNNSIIEIEYDGNPNDIIENINLLDGLDINSYQMIIGNYKDIVRTSEPVQTGAAQIAKYRPSFKRRRLSNRNFN